jgi:hypothetical protein
MWQYSLPPRSLLLLLLFDFLDSLTRDRGMETTYSSLAHLAKIVSADSALGWLGFSWGEATTGED